jgi:hypothetical protein
MLIQGSLPIYPATQPCTRAPLNATAACDTSAPLEARLDALLSALHEHASAKQRAGLLQNLAAQVDTLSIPAYHWWNEALHGVAGDGAASAGLGIGACFKPVPGLLQPTKCATSFPAAITTACALNTTLTRAVGSAIGTEARVFSNLAQTGLTFWSELPFALAYQPNVPLTPPSLFPLPSAQRQREPRLRPLTRRPPVRPLARRGC